MVPPTCLVPQTLALPADTPAPTVEPLDPHLWEALCRWLSRQRPAAFTALARRLASAPAPRKAAANPTPLVSLGPSGLGGPYQHEYGA